ncbi:Cg1 protein [Plasmodium sp. gorilla clade G3]|nr:Cg1 protein [Plasmodium sp. gorilla clade G3]
MFTFLVIIVNVLVCICFLNTKYQIQLDYSVPSTLINLDRSLKYTNITVGKDSFLCILDKSDSFDTCEKYDLLKNVDDFYLNGVDEHKGINNNNKKNKKNKNNYNNYNNYNYINNKNKHISNNGDNQINNDYYTNYNIYDYVEEQLNKNFLLKYSDNNNMNYNLYLKEDNYEIEYHNVHNWMNMKEENIKGNDLKNNIIKDIDDNTSYKRSNNSGWTCNNEFNRLNNKYTKEFKEKIKDKKKKNHYDYLSNERSEKIDKLNNKFHCNFKKVYDYIFYKHKINAYHKYRIYNNINDDILLKNHIIKGKMLTINNTCIDAFSNGNILKICLNKSISFITKRYPTKHKKHITISTYAIGKDLLFSNNTVVQYYSDGKYFFEVLFLCGNNNLRVNSFEKLYNIYYPFIFQIYEHLNTTITKLYNIIIKKLKDNDIYFFKSFSNYQYSEHYYKSLKQKLIQNLNMYYPEAIYLYRITLSGYMFCNYTEKINPPNFFLLKNLMNKCHHFIREDDTMFEICLPYSVIQYKKNAFGKEKYPLVLLGSSYNSLIQGKPFYEKMYDIFPVLKSNHMMKKTIEYYNKLKGNLSTSNSLNTQQNLVSSTTTNNSNILSDVKYDYSNKNTLTSSQILSSLEEFSLTHGLSPNSMGTPGNISPQNSMTTPNNTFPTKRVSSSSTLSPPNLFPSSFNVSYTPFYITSLSAYFSSSAHRMPYVSTYIIDKPLEVLKYGNGSFYKALAFDLKGGKCIDSLDEVHDYLTTIYFDCSLNYKSGMQTKVVNVFQSTECHYYVHITSPYVCAHPMLHVPMTSKKETVKCFRNIYAASSQLQDKWANNTFNNIIYNKYDGIPNIISSNIISNDNNSMNHIGNIRHKWNDQNVSSYKNHNAYTFPNFLFNKEDILKNEHFISNDDKMNLFEFYLLQNKIFKNKNFLSFEAIPKDTEIIFGKKYHFGLGNYVRKRIYKSIPIFHIGNVVRHKYWNYQAVVVSWDYSCFAPNEWKQKSFSEYPPEFQNTVHYLLLINNKKKKNQNIFCYTKDSNRKNCNKGNKEIDNVYINRNVDINVDVNVDLNVNVNEVDHKNHFNQHDKNRNNKNKMDYDPNDKLTYNKNYEEKEKEKENDTNQTDEEVFHFAYVPESSLIYGDEIIYNEYLYEFFEKYNNSFHFYIPKKNHIIWKLFPYDFFNLIF